MAVSDGEDGGIETSCGRCRGTIALDVSMGTNSEFCRLITCRMFGTAKPPHSAVAQMERGELHSKSVRLWQGNKHSYSKVAQIYFWGKILRDTGSFSETTRDALFSFITQDHLRAEQSSFLSQTITEIRDMFWRFLHPPSRLPLDSHDLEEYLYSCACVKATYKKKRRTLRATRD